MYLYIPTHATQAAEKFKAPEASAVATKEAEQEIVPVEGGEESDGEEVCKELILDMYSRSQYKVPVTMIA